MNAAKTTLRLSELVDIQQINNLFEAQFSITAMPSAILDSEGNVLVAVGWQDICAKFHRIIPASCLRCHESDADIKTLLDVNKSEFLEYKCKSGLWNVAFPIVIDNEHIATFLIGHFFYDDDKVDMNFFRNQAGELGFNVDEYIEAVERIPIHNRERIRAAISYHRNMVEIMLENGIKNLKLALEIEDRKRAEKALLDSEATLRSITTSARDAIVMMDDQGKISFWNKAAAEMFGWDKTEVLGRDLHQILAPQSHHSAYSLGMQNFVGTGQGNAVGMSLELPALRKDQTEITVDLSLSAVKLGDHWQGVGIIRDISERKQVEESLQRSEESYRIFTSISSDYVFKCSRRGTEPFRVQWMAGAVESITGYSQKEMYEIGCWLKIAHPDDAERISAHVMKFTPGARGDVKFRIITKSGHVRWVKELCFCEKGCELGELSLYGTVQDITEQEMMHSQLLKTQKLESLAVLAGGIAHDFNNLLTGIIANISFAKTLITPGDKPFTKLEEAEKAADRAKDLTQQLLTFSKGGAPVKKIASIEYILMDSISFVLRGSNVKCEFMIPAGIWPVEVDAGQINQVINNLIINADQAMPKGGTIRVCMENLTLASNEIAALKAGQYVKFSIEDRGIGIPEAYLSKIFDPYFTTKQKGSGLGLATVYSIIRNHDGHIKVESKVGIGTVFHVYLPASTKELPGKCHEEDIQYSGQGKILVMDDEEMIREVVNDILGHLGHKVVLCSDGVEAIELYRKAVKEKEPFDAVIMDLTVPGGMGGKETMKKLLEIDNEVKGIVSSGYCNDPILSNYREYGFSGVVEKPYNVEELINTVQKIISNY